MSTFDERAREWDDQPGRREHAERVAAAVVEAVSPTEIRDVLEVGAGTGLLAFALASAAGADWRFTLADTSAGMRDVAQAKVDEAGNGWRVVDWDVSTGDAPDEQFDLILTHMVMHHVEDVDALLRNARARLRPGGAFVALDLTPEGSEFHDHRAHEHTPTGDDPHYHHEGFGDDELRAHLALAGFSEVDYAEPLTVTRERDGVEREFPLFLAVAR